MAKEHVCDGIYPSHVVIDGGIAGDKMEEAMPEGVSETVTERLIDLEGITAAYWFLQQQRRQAWTFELDLRTWQEKW